MNRLKAHRVNFIERQPNAIHCLAYDESSQRLAVSRSDNSIEIWDLSHKPFMEKVIPSQCSNSVETVAWSKGRLFSAGLHGHIIEHDLITLIPKRSVAVVTNCSVWCISVNKQNTFIAAGTEEGQICIYSIANESFDFEKKLVKQEGRILCLDWHEYGEVIVTGSIDTIRIWNVESGQITERIIVGRTGKNVETIVWCLAVTSDMTIISGDSQGKVSFWNGKMGTLIGSPYTHKADVLSLCLNKDETVAYASGVDPVIFLYSRAQIKSVSDVQGKKVWMKSIQRILHTHDVRALVMAGDYLVSGGVDTNLVFSKFPPKTVHTYSPFPQLSYITPAPEASLILVRHSDELELWKMGSTEAEAVSDGQHLPLSSTPIKFLLMKAKENESFICSTISTDGSWIAYSDLHRLRLFHLEKADDPNKLIVHKVKSLPKEMTSARCMTFASGMLIASTSTGIVHILKCDINKCELLNSIESELRQICLLEVSRDYTYLAVGTHDGEIRIYNLLTCEVHCDLPMYKCQVTALKFDLLNENLIAVYSDRRLVEFDINKKVYSDWHREQNFSAFQDCGPYVIKGITLVSSNENLIVLHDEENLYVFDRSTEIEEPDKKRSKAVGNSGSETKFKTIKKFRNLLDFCYFKGEEVIAVEVKPRDIQSNLPPPLYRKKYGT